MNQPFDARIFARSRVLMRAIHCISFRRRMNFVMAGLLCSLIVACAPGEETTAAPASGSPDLSGLFEIAGDFGGAGSLDGAGTAARFNGIYGIASDAAGNLYVTDTSNFTVRKVTPGGVVTTFAGAASLAGATDGIGAAARFESPTGIAVAANGDIYVADAVSLKIRKITPAGAVTTLAGSGASGNANGPGATASFSSPKGIAIDSGGNVYVADMFNNAIRKVTPAGVVSTFAIGVSFPQYVAVDGSDNIYVPDRNTIVAITQGGVATTLAGTLNVSGYVDGTGAAARFFGPSGIAVDGSGNVYVADSVNYRIRKVTPAGVVTTLAGSGTLGSADGTGTAAQFAYPLGIAIDPAGTVYVSEGTNHTIRRISMPAAVVTLLAGAPAKSGSSDGAGSAARFVQPGGITADSAGNLFVADSNNNTIRSITPAGAVSTLAGSPGVMGSLDGSGSAARFLFPRSLTTGPDGNMYVADSSNNRIRKLTTAGVVTTLAGSSFGSNDGTGASAQFKSPYGIGADNNGNLYVADNGNQTVRKVTPAGVVTVFAGTTGVTGSTDATGAAAKFNSPAGVAVDGNGDVYVADNGNHTIRKITPAGVVSTLAGSAGSTGSADGIANAARFNSPSALAVGTDGNLYVTDQGNHTIRKVTQAGVVTTVAGVAGQRGILPGSLPGSLDNPSGITLLGVNTFALSTANGILKLVLP
jgi:sugar lactone lactonase YvrE